MSTGSTRITLGVLRLLLEDARGWWYHRKLREQGDIAEARRRERRSVRRHAEDLKQAVVLHVGRGGWSLYRNQGRLEGHGGIADLLVQAAIRAGVPVVDSSAVPLEKLGPLLGGPLPDAEPLAALEFARSLGATTYNAPSRCKTQREVARGSLDRSPL
jgi:hypothetical protein